MEDKEEEDDCEGKRSDRRAMVREMGMRRTKRKRIRRYMESKGRGRVKRREGMGKVKRREGIGKGRVKSREVNLFSSPEDR